MNRGLHKLRLTCGVLCLGALALASYEASAQYLGLTGANLGSPQVAGQVTENTYDVPISYNIYGGGDDIWNTSDNCFYFYKPAKDGAFEAVVRVLDVQGPSAWAKCELMVRKDNGSGVPQGNDPHLSMMVTPLVDSDGSEAAVDLARPQMRTARGGVSDQINRGDIKPGNLYVPQGRSGIWLKVVKNGSIIGLYYATNGATNPDWKEYVTVDTAKAEPVPAGNDAQTQFGGANAFTGPMFVGIAVTGHTAADVGWATITDWSYTANDGVFIGDPIGAPLGFSIGVDRSGSSTVVASSAELTLDGTPVTTTFVVSPDGATTTFTYAGAPLVVGSQHTVTVSIKDGANNTYNKTATFTVPYYKTLTAAAKLADADVNKTVPGFKMRIHQADVNAGLPNNDARTELQLAGGYGPNLADTSAYVLGFTRVATVIDLENKYNTDPAHLGAEDGNFTNRMAWPGLQTANTNNFAAEIWAALEFPAAGLYTMIVNSDDGFKVNARGVVGEDMTSLATSAGYFSGGRGATDTPMWIYVEQAGMYLFRATYEQGGGGGSMEWIVLDSTGNKVLINDATSAVKAYAAGAALKQPPYFEAATPSGPAEPTSVVINATIVNADTAVAGGSITMKFDNNTVTPTISPQAGRTLISYNPGPLLNSSMHQVEISFMDSENVTIVKKWEFAVAGSITFRLFDLGVNDGAIGKLTGSEAYRQNNPLLVNVGGYSRVVDRATIEFNDDELVSGDYVGWGADFLGYFVPAYTTNYTFYISADDNAQLWLSTDAGPGNQVLIASEPSWSAYRDWLEAEDSATHANVAAKKSAPIPLVAGQRYFIHALASQGGGGGNLGVTWTWDGGPAVANGEAAKSAGLVPLSEPVAGSSPASLTVTQGRTFQLTGQAFIREATGLPEFQWFKGTTAIAGETKATYRKTNAQVIDSGDYKLQATFPTAQGNRVAMGVPSTVVVIPDNEPPVATAGACTNAAGAFEIGVGFNEAVDVSTLVQANFTVSGATVTGFEVVTNSWLDYGAVKFSVTGLAPGGSGTVTVQNVKDVAGNIIAATGPISFKVSQFGWAETGVPKVPGNVVPVGEDGFDLLSSGRTEWAGYDEISLAYLTKTGDFDVKLRIIDVEFASQWARCGIQARNSLDVGKPSTDDTFSAYAQLHANPNNTLASIWDPADPTQPQNPTPNNNFEQNCRLGTGDDTSGWGTGGGGPPVYPNVYLRLQRVGAAINGFRSTDGVNWTATGSVTLTTQSPTMYVGAVWAPETGNIWGDRSGVPFDPVYDRLYVARIREVGDYSALPPILDQIDATVAANGDLTITWTGPGRLQSSPALSPADWQDVAGATSPYPITKAQQTGPAKFYRLIAP